MKRTRAPLAILISGRGSNMAALIDAACEPDCPYEVVLVASNEPDAPGLELARKLGIATFAHSHKGLARERGTARGMRLSCLNRETAAQEVLNDLSVVYLRKLPRVWSPIFRRYTTERSFKTS